MTDVENQKPLFRLKTLGGLALYRDDTVVGDATVQRKRLALLAALAVAGSEGLSRDMLLALFWAESDEARARNALKQAIFALRRAVGDEAIGGTDTLRLDASIVDSDVHQLRQSASARDHSGVVGIYAGPFLEGVFLSGAPEFERWTESKRAEFHRLFWQAGVAGARAAASAGSWTDAGAIWAKLTVADPLDGEAARGLAMSLVRGGNRTAAIAHARSYGTRVRNELGIEPDSAVIQIALGEEAAPTIPEPSGRTSREPAADLEPTQPLVDRRAPRRDRRISALKSVVWLAGVAVIVTASFAIRPSATKNQVIVARFENQTGDSALDMLGTVLSSAVAQGLAATGELHVFDLPTTLRATASRDAKPLVAMARESGVGYILRGDYRRRGDTIVVQSTIVSGRDGAIVRSLEPVPAAGPGTEEALVGLMRERVLGAFAALNHQSEDSWSATGATLPIYAAQLEYARGIEARARDDEDSQDKALEYFLRAARIDSLFVAPRLQLVWMVIPDSIWTPVITWLEAHRNRLSEWERLATDASVAFRRSDFEESYRLYHKVVTLVPRDPQLLLLLQFNAMITNRFSESIDAFHRMSIEPGWVNGLDVAWTRDMRAHHMLGDFERALREWPVAREHFPDDWTVCAHASIDYAALGRLDKIERLAGECRTLTKAPPGNMFLYIRAGSELLWHGHAAAARALLDRAVRERRAFLSAHRTTQGDDSDVLFYAMGDWKAAYDGMQARKDHGRSMPIALAVAAARTGDSATARAVLARLDAGEHADSSYLVDRAKILLALGNKNDAIVALRAALPNIAPTQQLHAHAEFLELRDDPRFKALEAARR